MTEEPKLFVFDETGEAKRFAPATLRNRDAIVDVLRGILPDSGNVLEIASGTGEHILHFAAAFPDLIWQPSDYDAAGLASIAAWTMDSGLPNILPPIRIDAMASEWPIKAVDAVLCINMIHIAPWAATKGLFARAARLLAQNRPLYLYGPYLERKWPTTESNLAFDRSLKERNPDWGLRLLDDVEAIANAHGFALANRISMPANNLSLEFRRLLQ